MKYKRQKREDPYEWGELPAWIVATVLIVIFCMTVLAAYSFDECVSAQERLWRVCVAGLDVKDDADFKQAWEQACAR